MGNHNITTLLIGIFLLAALFFTISFQSTRAPNLAGEEKISLSVLAEEKEAEEIPVETEITEAAVAAAGGETVEAEEKPITEEIKETVVKAVEGAIGLFVGDDTDIVAIGDSLTQGVGDDVVEGGYVGIIENTLQNENENIEIQNFGKRGNRTDQLIKRLAKPEISEALEEAEVVLITIGANDIMKIAKNNFLDLRYEPFALGEKKYEQRLRTIFETVLSRNPEARIFLAGFYNPFAKYFGHIEELNNIVRNWNATASHVALDYEQVHYIPIHDLFEDTERDLLAEDNFHPNHQGYMLMAERILEHIKPAIIQDSGNDRSGETGDETAAER